MSGVEKSGSKRIGPVFRNASGLSPPRPPQCSCNLLNDRCQRYSSFKQKPVGERQSGQRTEQVKTGQVNPDRPLVGPSVDTFVGCFVGSP